MVFSPHEIVGDDVVEIQIEIREDLPFWELAPQEEKGVVLLEFISVVQGKFRGIVTVTTDHGTLMVPVEITAISGGVHSSTEELDFENDFKAKDISCAWQTLNGGIASITCGDGIGHFRADALFKFASGTLTFPEEHHRIPVTLLNMGPSP
eukprot:scaffold301335_cov27-Prasinocladus_malaysianus.AAC.1